MYFIKSAIAAVFSILPAVLAYFLVARAILDKNDSDIRYALALLIIFAACWLASWFWMPVQAR